ncbi:MAG: hypothetical protein J5636_11110 [Clostridiales bacterium]|nr:hypothetical protein [Clostridiales bacterium]
MKKDHENPNMNNNSDEKNMNHAPENGVSTAAEALFDAMSEVDDDLILKSEILPEDASSSPIHAVGKVRSHSWTVIAGSIAAGVLALVGLIVLITWASSGKGLFKAKKDPTTTPYHTTAEPPVTTTPPDITTDEPDLTTMPTEPSTTPPWSEPTTDEPPTESTNPMDQIRYAPDQASGTAIVGDTVEGAFAGEILMPYALMEEITNTENRDAYFAVSIQVCRFDFIDEYIAEQEAIYEEARKDPAIVRFDEAFRIWLTDVYMPQFTPEEWAAIEKQDSAGDIDLHEIFIEEYWSEKNPDDVAAYRDAMARLADAESLYALVTENDYVKDLYSGELESAFYAEWNRMQALGYQVDPVLPDGVDILDDAYFDIYNGFTLTGHLTGEQLANFENDATHGYIITWLTEEESSRSGDA